MNAVQQKISCVYVTGVSSEESAKRAHQTYKVSATSELTERALADDISSAKSTEKLDGTCCLIDFFQDKPWLWARHDRKPSKGGERRFAQFKKNLKQRAEGEAGAPENFNWDPVKDFKETPPNWVPASRLEIKDGIPMPDSIGHTPGWVPVELGSRQHCWHLTAVDLDQGMAMVLRESQSDPDEVVIEAVSLSSLIGKTCELIGTNINGNPYALGTKKQPVHLLVPHGSLSLPACPDPSDYDKMLSWFDDDSVSDSQVEGVVWHCFNGELHKLHRHHLNLPWPIPNARLCRKKVKVQVDVEVCSESVSKTPNPEGGDKKSSKEPNMFQSMVSLNGQTLESLRELHNDLNANCVES